MSCCVIRRLVRLSKCQVGVAKTPTGASLTDQVTQLTRYFVMQYVVLDRLLVVAEQCVCITKTVAGLCLKCTIQQLARNLQGTPQGKTTNGMP